VKATPNAVQFQLVRRSRGYRRVAIVNVMGPDTVRQFQGVIDALEVDEHLRGVVFDSAVDGCLLRHSDFPATLEEPDRSAAWPYRLAALAGFPPTPDARRSPR
jgi:hypothetical protein